MLAFELCASNNLGGSFPLYPGAHSVHDFHRLFEMWTQNQTVGHLLVFLDIVDTVYGCTLIVLTVAVMCLLLVVLCSRAHVVISFIGSGHEGSHKSHKCPMLIFIRVL